MIFLPVHLPGPKWKINRNASGLWSDALAHPKATDHPTMGLAFEVKLWHCTEEE